MKYPNKVQAFYAYRNKLIITLVLVIFILISTNSVFSQNITGHRIIPDLNQSKLDRIREVGKYDIDKYPVEKYFIDNNLINPIKAGEMLSYEILNLELVMINNTGEQRSFKIKDIDSAKTIVLDIWAIGCKPCILSMDKWNCLVDSLNKEVAFFGLYLGYNHYLVPYKNEKNWKVNSIFGLNAYVLTRSFLKAPLAGHLIWIKGGKLIAITNPSDSNLKTIKNHLDSNLVNLKSLNNEWTY